MQTPYARSRSGRNSSVNLDKVVAFIVSQSFAAQPGDDPITSRPVPKAIIVLNLTVANDQEDHVVVVAGLEGNGSSTVLSKHPANC